MQNRVVYRGKRPGHIIKVAPKRGYSRWIPVRYRKERD